MTMTITQLRDRLQDILDSGCHPGTAVVFGTCDLSDTSDWRTIESVDSPVDSEDWIWVTMHPGQEADPRFTPEHFTPEPPVLNPFTRAREATERQYAAVTAQDLDNRARRMFP